MGVSSVASSLPIRKHYMLSIDTVYTLFLGYVDANIVPKFTSLPKKAVLYSAIFIGNEKKDEILSQLKHNVLPTLGLTDENFNVDIDFLSKWGKYLLDKNNGEIEISKQLPFIGTLGYIADREDVENFITLLKEHEHANDRRPENNYTHSM